MWKETGWEWGGKEGLLKITLTQQKLMIFASNKSRASEEGDGLRGDPGGSFMEEVTWGGETVKC